MFENCKYFFTLRTLQIFQSCLDSAPPKTSTIGENDGDTDKVEIPKFVVPMAIIQDPCRLFMAVKFNFATSNNVPMESVRFKGIFRDTVEFGVKDFICLGGEETPLQWLQKFQELDENSRSYVIAVSGLLLQGVNWDFEKYVKRVIK